MFYVTRSLSGPLACADTFHEALTLAYEFSARTSSPSLVPSEIECLNTGERFDADAIVSWWRKLGWPLPEPDSEAR
jgi:hypothetical protein